MWHSYLERLTHRPRCEGHDRTIVLPDRPHSMPGPSGMCHFASHLPCCVGAQRQGGDPVKIVLSGPIAEWCAEVRHEDAEAAFAPEPE